MEFPKVTIFKRDDVTTEFACIDANFFNLRIKAIVSNTKDIQTDLVLMKIQGCNCHWWDPNDLKEGMHMRLFDKQLRYQPLEFIENLDINWNNYIYQPFLDVKSWFIVNGDFTWDDRKLIRAALHELWIQDNYIMQLYSEILLPTFYISQIQKMLINYITRKAIHLNFWLETHHAFHLTPMPEIKPINLKPPTNIDVLSWFLFKVQTLEHESANLAIMCLKHFETRNLLPQLMNVINNRQKDVELQQNAIQHLHQRLFQLYPFLIATCAKHSNCCEMSYFSIINNLERAKLFCNLVKDLKIHGLDVPKLLNDIVVKYNM